MRGHYFGFWARGLTSFPHFGVFCNGLTIRSWREPFAFADGLSLGLFSRPDGPRNVHAHRAVVVFCYRTSLSRQTARCRRMDVALLAFCITMNQLATDRLDNWLAVIQSILVTYSERVKVSALLRVQLKAFRH